MKRKNARNNIIFGNSILVFSLLIFILIIARASQLSLSTTIDGINLKRFASSRTTQTDILPAKRGTVYDVNGNVLAQNVYSYTIIAYLDSNRTTNPKKPSHVMDVAKTAELLAPILDMDVNKLKEVLAKNTYTTDSGEVKNVYQTELGTKGKGLTELVKDKIIALQLPGIDFVESQKRYYPNGNFLAYTIGYAKNNTNGTITGEMGIEQFYNDALSGVDGSITYQKDLKGYKIAGTPELKTDAISGKDVYLTIDDNIQLFVEQAIKNSAAKYTFENLNIMVADAHTGKILGMSTYPSFDPNVKDIKNYLDPNVAVSFEPGSTMKIYSYMAAMEAGVYKGNDTFKSGVYVTKDGTEIGDHDRRGWGTITYDRGFALSSNIGALNLVDKYINRDILREYYQKLGFGSKTGIELPKESSGKLDFKYETEVFNAAFGQGIMTTASQNVKALTSLSNGGMLLQPYLVDRIVDPLTGKTIYQGAKKELGIVASKATVDKMIELMRSVVKEGTGSPYYMDGYDIVAKTGTAQIASTNGTGYLKGETDVIRAFAGLYPGNDPKFIIYATVKKPNPNSPAPLSSAIKEIIQNMAKYMNIKEEDTPKEEVSSHTLDSYQNQTVERVISTFEQKGIKAIIIGDGTKVIGQYPKKGTVISSKEKVYFISNGSNILMPDVKGWSRKEVETLFQLMEYSSTFSGTGYVTGQGIAVGTPLTKDTVLTFTLKQKFALPTDTITK